MQGTKYINEKSTKSGFGDEIVELAEKNEGIVCLTADLKNSTNLGKFAEKFPHRFFEVGIAEQNMASISAGLAINGKIPFMTSHAIFSPSRNWDQIRISICLSDANVKIVGTHLGFTNGPDGAVAESLEDVALMRVLPNITIICPIDYNEARKATREIVKHKGPVYFRLAKADTPVVTLDDSPFEIGKAYLLTQGKDVTIVSSGPITVEALAAANELKAKHKIEVEVINCPTIKPLDEHTILESAKKTGKVVTLEEHQVNGGLGGAVCELLSEKLPTPVVRMGMKDKFGESGSYKDLKDKYGLSSHHIVSTVLNFSTT